MRDVERAPLPFAAPNAAAAASLLGSQARSPSASFSSAAHAQTQPNQPNQPNLSQV